MTTTHITIDLDDVVIAGGVSQAIIAWCERSDDTSSGIVGPSFSTSGPGSGWSRQHDADDFAQRAIEEGALYYLDASDGRLIEAEEVSEDECDEDGEWPTDTFSAMDGCRYRRYRLTEWSENSVVCLTCPDVEEAIEHPHEVAEMAQAVIDYHSAESDTGAWRDLIAGIRTAAAALDGIDLDDFEITK